MVIPVKFGKFKPVVKDPGGDMFNNDKISPWAHIELKIALGQIKK